MKRNSAMLAAAVVVGGLAVASLGFLVGRMTSPPQREGALPQESSGPAGTSPSPEQEGGPPLAPDLTAAPSPSLQPAQGIAQQEGEEEPEDTYLLRSQGDELVVWHDGRIVVSFANSLDTMGEETLAQLEQGMGFGSLSEIESFLEDFES